MEYLRQMKFKFYTDDFQFHISRQGTNGEEVFSRFHWHEFIEILYCDEGTMLVTLENTEYTMKPGDMLLIGPNVVHKTFKAKNRKGSIYNLLFATPIVQGVTSCSSENRCINSFLNYLSSFNYHYYTEKDTVPLGIEELLKKMEKCFYSEGDYNCIYLRAYLLDMVGRFCEHGVFPVEPNGLSRQTVEAINSTIEYIQTHCNEKITLSDMAEKANLSYHYYSRLFKIVTGKTFSAYLASARVFMAEKLMIEGRYSLQEIADKVGLYPQSNFNHTYKRLRGFSPNEFMRKIR